MIQRRNMIELREEHWRPPLLAANQGRKSVTAALRRYFDLQVGSIWNDLATELATARGVALDVGCGAQPYRALFPPEVTYIGIDTADAKDHFGYEMPDTLYYGGDVWPVADRYADLVLCTETMEHVPDPPAFLAEAFRCLKPGGRLVLTVPFSARYHFIPHDYWRFTPSALNRLLTAAGFTDVAVYARGNALTVACYKGMALFLPLLFPQTAAPLRALLLRLLGLLCLPLFVLLAVVANLSLHGAGGDDCLGYTVLARRAPDVVSGIAPGAVLIENSFGPGLAQAVLERRHELGQFRHAAGLHTIHPRLQLRRRLLGRQVGFKMARKSSFRPCNTASEVDTANIASSFAWSATDRSV